MSLKRCPECDGFTYITTACIEVKIATTGQIMRSIDDRVDFNDIDQSATCTCSECGYETTLNELMD